MKIVLFSGTTEGRRLSRVLAAMGARVTVCVATQYGAEEQGRAAGVQVRVGRLDKNAMRMVLGQCDLCIDATHPYAVEATANIRQAAAETGVLYRRLLRTPSPLPANSLVAADAVEAAALLRNTRGAVLLTTGAKELPAFAGLGPERLYPRVLPLQSSLVACEKIGIPHRNIIAMQGPFNQALNVALIRQFDIRYLVTKDGGIQGGFAQKAAAAQETGIALVVIQRPAEHGWTEEEIVKECKKMLL